jgi:putative ABC transport system permease protein
MAILLIVAGGFLLSILAGSYPAFIISRYQPIGALKGQLSKGRENHWLKKSLITFQFCISIVLTISALTLYSQMKYIQNKKIGFDKDLVISLPGDRQILEKYNALKTEILSINEIGSVSLAYDSPIDIKGGYDVGLDASGQNNRPVTALPTGLDFIETMNMEILAGNDLTQMDMVNADNLEKDSTLLQTVIINEALATTWGWSNEDAVGKIINFNSKRSVVKGVVKDFHFASLHQPIEPLVIFPENWGRFILVKLKGQEINKTLDQLKTAWTSVVTHRPFSYSFLDNQYKELYRFEAQNAQVTYVFTWLAIFLACLGLFGIASYGFAQRKKEIGIRKVLGSSILSIFSLLSREYLILVSIAIVLASPLAYLAMSKWLEQFAYGVKLQWWMFALAGCIAFIIALVTLSFQGIKAALLNPMESLRSE